MKVIVTTNNLAHQVQHAAWIAAGLKRCGWRVDAAAAGAPLGAADMVCCWGVKQKQVWAWQKQTGNPVLVMERAALQPRTVYTSMGFNGLAGRGTYPRVDDGGTRWRKHFGQHMKPWRVSVGCYVLLCGQVIGDAAIWGVDFRTWAQQVTSSLKLQGKHVRYRPHPFSLKHGDKWKPFGAEFSERAFEDDLKGAECVVTYTSTAGGEAVLAGVPAVAWDRGSMAWEVTAHDLDAPRLKPDRLDWAHRLAFTCWRPEEIESGKAWEYTKEALPCLV